MEITIVKEEEYYYTVTIGDKRIETIATSSNEIVTQWLRQIKRIYFNNNNKQNHKLLVGLCADRPKTTYMWGGKKEMPFDILQLCIGTHCLVLYDIAYSPTKFPTPLRDFLKNSNVEFVGIGIRGVADKFQELSGLYIDNTLDLHELVKEAMGRNDLSKRGLERLAKEVLLGGGEEDMMVIDKRGQNEWYHPANCHWLSNMKVKFATFDAFLSCQIGEKCRNIIRDRKSNITTHVSAASSSS